MEGARWNRDAMCIDEMMNGQLSDCMPLILLQPYKRSETLDEMECSYEAPVYRTLNRQSISTKSGHSNNFVTFLTLNSKKPATHWMFRGVALLCQLND